MSDSNPQGENSSMAKQAAELQAMLKPIDFAKIQAATAAFNSIKMSEEVKNAAKMLAELAVPKFAESMPDMNLLASLVVPDLTVIKQFEMPKIPKIEMTDFPKMHTDFERVRDLVIGAQANYTEQFNHIKSMLDGISTSLTTPFEHLFFENRLSSLVNDLIGINNSKIAERLRRHHERHLIVGDKLPSRGWYLTGTEPIGLTFTLAEAIENNDWDRVDQKVMEHLPVFDEDKLRAALVDEGVPEHCINRLCKFLQHHRSGNYEEATYLGVPLIDELARCMYKGKDFTTKGRANPKNGKMRPQIAMASAGAPALKEYHSAFVSDFGSLQHESNTAKVADENYWNRHAIVHGQMKRPMGAKDSAKCLMAISFVLSAKEEPKPTPQEEVERLVAELEGRN
ncbi:hypothetical protein [Anatilimnocola floriformis]|uniref:hypothetical protein n=1 Tax=Anatilimnocola floriformis TaxID=2948575 RepID=UPI0020C46C6A|nr:hypothetical protein [Anatilimnocola floriformis]